MRAQNQPAQHVDVTLRKRRKLNLKPKLETGSSCFSFKRLVPVAFQLGLHRFNLHRPTLTGSYGA